MMHHTQHSSQTAVQYMASLSASGSPAPKKQHFIVDYMIYDDSMQLEQTAANTYKLTFKYYAESPLTCSVFTFVEESFNVTTATTENLKSDTRYGSEQHLQLQAG